MDVSITGATTSIAEFQYFDLEVVVPTVDVANTTFHYFRSNEPSIYTSLPLANKIDRSEWYVRKDIRILLKSFGTGQVDMQFLRYWLESDTAYSDPACFNIDGRDYPVNFFRGMSECMIEEYGTSDPRAVFLKIRGNSILDFSEAVSAVDLIREAVLKEWTKALSRHIAELTAGQASIRYSQKQFLIHIRPNEPTTSNGIYSDIYNRFRFAVHVEHPEICTTPIYSTPDYRFLGNIVNQERNENIIHPG